MQQFSFGNYEKGTWVSNTEIQQAAVNDSRKARIERDAGKAEENQVKIETVEAERSGAAVEFENHCDAHGIKPVFRNGSAIPKIVERFKFPYRLYRIAALVTLGFIAAIGIYLSLEVMNLWWLLVLVFAAICLITGDRLIPAFIYPIHKVDSEKPGSQRPIEYALCLFGVFAIVNFIGYYIGRTSAATTGFLAENHLTMLALCEIFLIVVAALLYLLVYYYGWSHRLTAQYEDSDQKLRALQAEEGHLFGSLVAEYEAYEHSGGNKMPLSISIDMRLKLKKLMLQLRNLEQLTPSAPLVGAHNNGNSKLLEANKSQKLLGDGKK